MQEWEKLLNEQELHVYAQYFGATRSAGSNVVTGQDAVRFFARSGIPNEILSDIWETSDVYNVGYLDPETFSIALKLIACAQHGRDVQDPILSTEVPLPRFEGFDIATMLQNKAGRGADTGTGTVTGVDSGIDSDTISASDREKYLQLFARQPLDEGCVSAETATRVFARSRLPNDVLAQIWNLADVRKAGNLNQTEFVIAMHYIAKMMDGSIDRLPSHLPSAAYRSASGSIQSSPLLRRTSVMHSPVASPHSPVHLRAYSPIRASVLPAASPAAAVRLPSQSQSQSQPHYSYQPQPQRTASIDSLGNAAFGPTIAQDHQNGSWDVSAQEKEQYDAFFDKIDAGHRGHIEGPEAVEFFNNSKLPPSELARIWDMADIEGNGRLTKDEFAIAMHLINARLQGIPLPSALPKTLVPPPPLVMPHMSTPRQPQQSEQPEVGDGDLLGEFDNSEELTTVTNEVNQLQYQITTLHAALKTTRTEKANAEKARQQQKMETDAWREQAEQLGVQQSSETQQLAQLRAEISAEEPSWTQIRQLHERVVQDHDVLREQIDKTKHALELGSAEGDRLRRRVHDVQAETKQFVQQLDHLRSVMDAKKQARSQPAGPETDPFAVPDNPTTPAEEKLTFDDAFSSSTPPVTSSSLFDDAFGTHDKPSKRPLPPPPPPQRRPTQRHPQQQLQQQQSGGQAKKARAPPPPPPLVKSSKQPQATQEVPGKEAAAASAVLAGTAAAAITVHKDSAPQSTYSSAASSVTSSSFVSSPEVEEDNPPAVFEHETTAGPEAGAASPPGDLQSTEALASTDNGGERDEAPPTQKETLHGEASTQPAMEGAPSLAENVQLDPSTIAEHDKQSIAEHDDVKDAAVTAQDATVRAEKTDQDQTEAEATAKQERVSVEQEEVAGPRDFATAISDDHDHVKDKDEAEFLPETDEQASPEEKQYVSAPTGAEGSTAPEQQEALTQDEQKEQKPSEEDDKGETRAPSSNQEAPSSPVEPHVTDDTAPSQEANESHLPDKEKEDAVQNAGPSSDAPVSGQDAVETHEKEAPDREQRENITSDGDGMSAETTEASHLDEAPNIAQGMTVPSDQQEQQQQQQQQQQHEEKHEEEQDIEKEPSGKEEIQEEEEEEGKKQVEEEKEAKEEDDKRKKAQTSVQGGEELEQLASNVKENKEGQPKPEEEEHAQPEELSRTIIQDADDITAPLGDGKDKGSSDTGEGDSFEMISSTNSPVRENKETVDEFDEVFGTDLAGHKEPLSDVVENGQQAKEAKEAKEAKDKDEDDDDDFDAAFAGQLTEARMMRSEADPTTTATNTNAFDDAFQHDTMTTAAPNTSHKLSWATHFGGFNFDFQDDDKKPPSSTDDDWDSIFGVPAAAHDGKSPQATDEAGAPEHVGFQDAFSSPNSHDNISAFKEQQQQKEAPSTQASAGADPQLFSGDIRGHGPIDDLVAMGFDRKAAKEALERYDQDLEKATNFLLDAPQAS